MTQSISILDAMKRLGFRFVGTGGGRLYFHRVTAAGLEHREFKTWADVESFARENTKGN